MSDGLYRVGDYVVHPTKPEWGPGRVLQVVGSKVTVYFRDAPQPDPRVSAKIIGVDKVSLCVCPDLSDPALENLPPFSSGTFSSVPKTRVTFDDGIKRFHEIFPLYFKDPKYTGTLKEGERHYKLSAHERFQTQLGVERLQERLLDGRIRDTVTELLQIFDKLNLLSKFEKAALRDALKVDEPAGRFLEALARVLATGPERGSFEDYLAAIDGLPSQQGKTDPAKWPVATLFPFIARPTSFMFLKPQKTVSCADRLMFDLHYSPRPNWPTYAKLLEMSDYLLARLREYGATDFIDVQSFIYVIGGGWDDA